MNQPFGTGAYHSDREYRDAVHETTLATPLPSSFNADYSRVPIQMQHQLGICTAEAVCSLIERFRNDGKPISRRFTYLVGKKLVDLNLTEGSSIKSMLIGALKFGTQLESVIPTDTTLPYEVFVDLDISPFIATATKIPGYKYVNTDTASLMDGIYNYSGLAARFEVGQEWWTPSWLPKDILPLRPPMVIISGHAVVLDSYDATGAFTTGLINSWSVAWGMNGRGYNLPANYNCTEAWAISPMPIDPSPLPNPNTWKHGFYIDLKYGMTGDEVKNLQTALSILGYLDKKYITGNYLGITAGAVWQFQKDHCITNLYSRFIVLTNFGRYCSGLTRMALNKFFA